MIDGMQAAIAKINNTIPKEVLEIVFGKPDYSQSIDRTIIDDVLLPRMRDDISIRGGKVMHIPLQAQWCEPLDNIKSEYVNPIYGIHSVYHIPPEVRELRDISCVLRVRKPHQYHRTGGVSGGIGLPRRMGNTLGSLTRAALDSQTGADAMIVPIGDVKPGNIIYIDPPQFHHVPWVVDVRLRYDDNFSGMDVSLIGPFADLCLCAVQAYIWTKLIVPIETNMVYRGADLGVIGELVRKYEDAHKEYDEKLLVFGGAEIISVERFKDFAQYIVGRV